LGYFVLNGPETGAARLRSSCGVAESAFLFGTFRGLSFAINASRVDIVRSRGVRRGGSVPGRRMSK
jgi:hypothetical protein